MMRILILNLFFFSAICHADMTAAINKHQNKDYLGAFRETKVSASKNIPFAQAFLGNYYYNGIGVVKDKKKALDWYTKSANQGFPPAQYDLAKMYERGEGTEIDINKSMYWLNKAVEKDYPPAQSWLASNYVNGTGVSRNLKLAKEWYEKAAIQDNANAQFNLGATYANGTGVPVDKIKAFAWLRLSADNGYADAKKFIHSNYRTLTEEEKTKVEKLYARYKQDIKPFTKFYVINYIDISKFDDNKKEFELTRDQLNQRLYFNGFSVNPPEGDDWSGYGIPELTSAVRFKKYIRSRFLKKELASNIIKVEVVHLDNDSMSTEDFKKHIKTMDMLNKEAPGQMNMELSLTEEKFKGARCVRFESTLEDDTLPYLPSGKVFIFTTFGLECIHPKSPGIQVSIVFNQRSYKDKKVKSLKNVVDDFIQGVEFTEYK